MKRGLDSIEISDDEWSSHDFDSSRILPLNNKPSNSKPSQSPPPAIESFAFKPTASKPSSSSSSSDCVEFIKEQPAPHSLNHDSNLEDHDFEEAPSTTVATRGRRFVIDDDDDAIEDLGFDDETESEEELEDEVDVVGKALQKCANISAQLRSDLFGSSTVCSDRFAQVDDVSSSVRIVTHDDVSEACGSTGNGFQLLLKPYQLVGVNFLMLLYRKKVAGVTS